MKKNPAFLIISVFIILLILSPLLTMSKVIQNPEITPNEDFFTTAIDYFDIDPLSYHLTVSGAVSNPLNFSLEEIKAMPVTSEIVRLTCIAYKYGANDKTGVANFTGVTLSYILDLAEVDFQRVLDISFHTPDLEGYSTSLNTEEAFWDDVILAYEMNGVSLPSEHGFPLRLVCPRFYGYKWIKWVSSIIIETEDYEGYWESRGYEDSPYVDIDLQIYYDTPNQTLTSTHETPWLKLEFLLVIAALSIIIKRFFSKWRKILCY
jgi:DMSO/TMAO reductase YedYZ molybdopterin-dependent catalytic subunit